MTDTDNALQDAFRQGQQAVEAGRVPDFDAVWAGAESTVAQRRRRTVAVGGLAAAAALIAVVVIGQMRPVELDWQYVDPDELASGTSWAAPSDILLPEHQFDIYREIPVLIESTGTDGGTLL